MEGCGSCRDRWFQSHLRTPRPYHDDIRGSAFTASRVSISSENPAPLPRKEYSPMPRELKLFQSHLRTPRPYHDALGWKVWGPAIDVSISSENPAPLPRPFAAGEPQWIVRFNLI